MAFIACGWTKSRRPSRSPSGRLLCRGRPYPNWAHAGTVSLFERAGFAVVGRPSEKYLVVQREVRRRTRRCT
jgi:hypothetical protein